MARKLKTAKEKEEVWGPVTGLPTITYSNLKHVYHFGQ